MANVIKHKRGSGSDPVASDLVVGEVAIRTDVGKLFTKMDNGSVAEIAGGGSDIIINTLSSSSATGGGSATFNGSAYRFTLSQPPSVSAQQLLVSVNGVIQKPVAGTGQPSEGFSVSGNDIIFGDAPATGSDFFILTFKSLGVSEPADNTVTSAKIVDGAIVNADINASAAIAGSKIANSSITGSKLVNDTITAVQLANGAADVNVVLDGAIVNSKVNTSAAIAVSKLANFVNNNADNRLITGSGTANTLNGEANLTFDGDTLQLTETGGNSANGARLDLKFGNNNSTDVISSITFSNGVGEAARIQGETNAANNNGVITFHTDNSGTSGERLRIDSYGDINFGYTAAPLARTSAQVRYFGLGRDYWNGTKGDYRALRLRVYDNGADDQYGFGISNGMLEIQAQADIGFFAGGSGSGTGTRVHKMTLESGSGEFRILNGTKVQIDAASAPNNLALLNIGYDAGVNTETRAIDIDGNWSTGENKSISFTHGSNNADLVGQINSIHNSPGSSLRFGRLYHGANSNVYTMTLDSTSTTGADLTLHNGNLIFADGHGVDFSNTGGASGNTSHVLDDYEEGTFTPVFENGLVFSSYATNGQRGVYTKIGRFVYGTIRLDGAAVSTQNSNQIRITGLPFASINFSDGEQVGGADPFFQDGFYNANDFSGIVNNNSSKIQLVKRSDGSSLTGSDVNGGRQIRISFSYFAAN